MCRRATERRLRLSIFKREEKKCEPLYRPQPRPAARRPETRPVRSLRVPVARRPVENRDHPECKSECRRAPSRRHLPAQHRQRRRFADGHRLSYVFSKPQNGKQTFNVFLAKGADRARSKLSGRRSSPMQKSHSAPSRTSSRRATTHSSPAVAATLSSSISTASRICSTSGANGISPSLT